MDDLDSRQCATRTTTAINGCIGSIHVYLLTYRDIVNIDLANLARDTSPDDLAAKFSAQMPYMVKVAFGREDGIDLEECALLTEEPSCIPDSKSVGSYFAWGLPIYEEDDVPMPSPAYGGESCNTFYSMEGRTDQHLDPEHRAQHCEKMFYRLLDDDDAPHKPYVLAMQKTTAVDKVWCRFSEMVTRQLLGLNAKVAANARLLAIGLPFALHFTRPITPTNCTDISREGYSAVQLDVVQFSERNAARKEAMADMARAYREDRRERFICKRCGTSQATRQILPGQSW